MKNFISYIKQIFYVGSTCLIPASIIDKRSISFSDKPDIFLLLIEVIALSIVLDYWIKRIKLRK